MRRFISIAAVALPIAGAIAALGAGFGPSFGLLVSPWPRLRRGLGGGTSGATGRTGRCLPATPSAPVNTTAPVISGTAQQGDTLSVSNGAWSGSPTGFSYAWQDCDANGLNCVAISGAGRSTYTLQAGDVGNTIEASVTATNAGGSATATANATAVVTAATPAAPVNTTAPVISGTAQQGDTLSVSNGAWSGSPTGLAMRGRTVMPTV